MSSASFSWDDYVENWRGYLDPDEIKDIEEHSTDDLEQILSACFYGVKYFKGKVGYNSRRSQKFDDIRIEDIAFEDGDWFVSIEEDTEHHFYVKRRGDHIEVFSTYGGLFGIYSWNGDYHDWIALMKAGKYQRAFGIPSSYYNQYPIIFGGTDIVIGQERSLMG